LAQRTLGTTTATNQLFHGQVEGDELCHHSLTHADLTMNKLQFKGEWHELKGKLRQKFADLTDNDMDYAEGQEEEFLGHLQKKLGKSQDEIAQLVNTP
jgi:uncharacterized protein YjbJ (UPF0337 family)